MHDGKFLIGSRLLRFPTPEDVVLNLQAIRNSQRPIEMKGSENQWNPENGTQKMVQCSLDISLESRDLWQDLKCHRRGPRKIEMARSCHV
jgi:hypothetical protein